MYKINFNFTLKNLDGSDITENEKGSIVPANAGKKLAGVLFQSAEGDALKFKSWAFKLYNGETLELDASDFSTLKDFISKPNQIINFLKAPLLEVMTSAKDE